MNSTSPPVYQDTFRHLITSSLRYVLTRVQKVNGLLPDDLRKQVLYTLGQYGFDLPTAWPLTRELLLQVAPKMEQAGFREEWIPYLQSGIRLSQTAQDKEATAYLHLQLGILYQLRAKYDSAWQHFFMSSQEFAVLQQPRLQADSLNRLAYLARVRREYKRADVYVQAALRLLPDAAPEREYSYFVLAMIALDHEAWQQAIDFFQQSLVVALQHGRPRQVARAYRNLGVALRQVRHHPEAIDCYETAISLFEEAEDRIEQAVTRMNLGNIYLQQDQPTLSLALYQQAEPILSVCNDTVQLANLAHNQGIALRQLGCWDLAKQHFENALIRWRQLGALADQANSLDELGLLYQQEGAYEQAVMVFSQALALLAQDVQTPDTQSMHEIILEHLQQLQHCGMRTE